MGQGDMVVAEVEKAVDYTLHKYFEIGPDGEYRPITQEDKELRTQEILACLGDYGRMFLLLLSRLRSGIDPAEYIETCRKIGELDADSFSYLRERLNRYVF